MEDRLSDLPDALKIRILSRIKAKQAVQTSMLSRTWVSSLTQIPVLVLNNYDFYNRPTTDQLCKFEKFVNEVLCRRDRLSTLDRLKLTHDDKCKIEILKTVFDYAFSHGVKHLDARVHLLYENDGWPVQVCDSLTSLKLQARLIKIKCPFLGPGHVPFKNLTVLYLKHAIIPNDEPFSRFPMLKSLTMIFCMFWKESEGSIAMKVHALQLSHLTIFGCKNNNYCELKTPRLKYLKYKLRSELSHEGLSVLETLEIDAYSSIMGQEKREFDDLMSLFCTLDNVKSVRLSTVIVHILLMFPDELVTRGLPFRGLNDLELDLREYKSHPSWFHKPSRESFETLKAYLLYNSPDVKLTITNPI